MPGFGNDTGALLADARVLIVGVGGTGCAAAAALGATGIGTLVLNDFDRVDTSNLARQTLFGDSDVGALKADIAASRLRAQNTALTVDVHVQRLDAAKLTPLTDSVDIVLDCSDNFATRFLLNACCVNTRTTLVTGSAIRWEGQLGVFGPDYTRGPCYRCLYSDDDESLEDCAGAGVLASLPATIGTMMASETLKAITGVGVATHFSIYDARNGTWQALRVDKRADCPACAKP